MVAQPLTMVAIRLTGKPLTALHYSVCGIILLFGGLTLAINDPFFILIKPTVVYVLMAAALTVSLLLGKNPAKTMLAKSVHLQHGIDHLWVRTAWQWMILLVLMGFLNLVIAFTLPEETWVTLKTFAFPAMIFITLCAQIIMLQTKVAKTPKYNLSRKLEIKFRPTALEVHDDSADHLGHPEAHAGNHLRVTIASPQFAGLSLLERHRLVYLEVGNLAKQGIHALSIIATATPDPRNDKPSTQMGLNNK